MSIPEFTPEQAAKVAEFEAAPTPPEVLREQVARELWAADAEVDVDQLSGETPQRLYRLADAALAVFRGQQDPAVQRVLALAEQWEREEAGPREERAKCYPSSGPWAIDHAKLITRAATYRTCAGNLRRAAIGGDGR